VNQTCRDWHDQLDSRGDFPVKDFDPENPKADQLPLVGDYFATAQPAAEDGLSRLRQLSPPADLQTKVAALIAALQAQSENANAQIQAAHAKDVGGFQATLGPSRSLHDAVEKAENTLGSSECSKL
jgi:hypothetical protein